MAAIEESSETWRLLGGLRSRYVSLEHEYENRKLFPGGQNLGDQSVEMQMASYQKRRPGVWVINTLRQGGGSQHSGKYEINHRSWYV